MNLGHLEQLLRGEVEPTTQEDEIFLVSYNSGIASFLVKDLLTELKDEVDEFGKEQWIMLVFGYMMGQKDLFDMNDELEIAIQGGKIH